MKRLILMRGFPGSGKSTMANRIAMQFANSVIYATDDFWMNNGRYEFDPTRLTEAHEWNQARCEKALEEDKVVIVDNCNICQEHMQPYLDMASRHGAEVEKQVAPLNNEDLETLFRNNSHDVPYHIFEKMKEQWED